MAGSAGASTVALPEDEKEHGRGHIGLVVLVSIVGGLILGLVLVLGVFSGGREDVITGAALIALAFGMLMLVELARRRTDQPQPWALVPGLGLGVAGLALLILRPSDRVLGRLGWVWPLLLALVVVWSVGVRAALCTTGRVERFSIRHSPSWRSSLLGAHSKPSWRRRRATTRLPAAAPTSSLATACICVVGVQGLRL
jgi:hypothetical protein